MTIVRKWSGDGLTADVLTTSSAGVGDDSFDTLTSAGVIEISETGGRSPRLNWPDTSNNAQARWDGLSLNDLAYRHTFTFSAALTNTFVFAQFYTGGTPTDSFRVGMTYTGKLRLTTTGDNVNADAPVVALSPDTLYRVEVVRLGTTATAYLYVGDSDTAIATCTKTVSAAEVTNIWIGNTVTATNPGLTADDIAVSDQGALIGPVSAYTPPEHLFDISYTEEPTEDSDNWTTSSGSMHVWPAEAGGNNCIQLYNEGTGVQSASRNITGLTAAHSYAVTIVVESSSDGWTVSAGGNSTEITSGNVVFYVTADDSTEALQFALSSATNGAWINILRIFVDEGAPSEGNTDYYLAVIGDSLTYQNGNGEASLRSLLTANGWYNPNISFYACSGKGINYRDSNNRLTTEDIQAARDELEHEPYMWVISLGTNGASGYTSTDIDNVVSKINEVENPGRILWIGCGDRDATAKYTTFNNMAAPIINETPDGEFLNYQAFASSIDPSNFNSSDGLHMPPQGYALRNDYVVGHIGEPPNGEEPTGPQWYRYNGTSWVLQTVSIAQ